MISFVFDTLAELRGQLSSQLIERLDTIRAQFVLIDPVIWQFAGAVEARLSTLLKSKTKPTITEWQVLATELERLLKLARSQPSLMHSA